jgi:hypothetical protein
MLSESLAIHCEFEAGNEDDRETTLSTSVVNGDGQKSELLVHYYISSPDVHMRLSLVQFNTSEILHSSLLPSELTQFRFDDSDVPDQYQIFIVVFRSSTAGGSTNEFVEISDIRLNSLALLEGNLQLFLGKHCVITTVFVS